MGFKGKTAIAAEAARQAIIKTGSDLLSLAYGKRIEFLGKMGQSWR